MSVTLPSMVQEARFLIRLTPKKGGSDLDRQGKEIQFKMCLRPTITSESRGGASFRKARAGLEASESHVSLFF